MNEHGNALRRQGQNSKAQPLLEKALEIRRRLLSDHNPETADTVALNGAASIRSPEIVIRTVEIRPWLSATPPIYETLR
jgi:hypothetical protein